jgi:cyclopropane fatty-acyl-phospholipid synthase-like methyltransferase
MTHSPTGDARRFAPATTRNRDPILAVLARYVRDGAHVLEISSGTGEHAVYFAEHLPVASWQPTDPSPEARASIDAWAAHAAARAAAHAPRVRPALALDVTQHPWPITHADVVVNINMIHIAPWTACLALLDGAARVLPTGGILYLYGPYRRGGTLAPPSNAAFDESLRARDPAWGIRDLETVTEEAKHRGFALEDVVEMPANNLSVVLRRAPP